MSRWLKEYLKKFDLERQTLQLDFLFYKKDFIQLMWPSNETFTFTPNKNTAANPTWQINWIQYNTSDTIDTTKTFYYYH